MAGSSLELKILRSEFHDLVFFSLFPDCWFTNFLLSLSLNSALSFNFTSIIASGDYHLLHTLSHTHIHRRNEKISKARNSPLLSRWESSHTLGDLTLTLKFLDYVKISLLFLHQKLHQSYTRITYMNLVFYTHMHTHTPKHIILVRTSVYNSIALLIL